MKIYIVYWRFYRLVFAIITINLALVFYTIGVWAEQKQKVLKKWHLGIFAIGLLFDTIGTSSMSKIAGSGFQLNFHGITGLMAIVLMLVHVTWAAVVIFKNNEEMKFKFHKFSVFVWCVWLIPFFSGAMFGMMK